MPPQPTQLPTKPIAHGGPTRQYLNMNVTPHLLEGMKYLAANEPEKPLQWLSEFLAERSKAVEG
jgi:COMPASS component SDC1